MKKIILIFLTGLLLFGCGENTKEQKPEEQKDQFTFDTTDIKATPVDNPSQSFYLRYKLEKGKSYNFRLTAISKDEQTISSKDTTMTQNMDQTMVYNMRFTTKEVDSDSTMEMEAEVTSIKVDGTFGNEPVHYQSGTKNDSADVARFAQYESLVKNPFDVRVSKLGEVLDVYRADKIVNKLLDIRGYADSLKADEKATLKNDITEGMLKPMLSQVFRKLPAQKISKDSTWKLEQPPTQLMVFQAQNTTIFEVTGTENFNGDLLADVAATLKTKISGKNKMTDRGINYEFKQPETTGGGKIYFNVSKGLVQKTKLYTSVTTSYNMESQGQKGTKTEVISNTNYLEYIP